MLSLRPNEINNNDVTQSWLTVPSQSIPTWGSIINFDVTTIGKINEIYVVFNMGPVTGITAVNQYPCMVSSFKWFTNVNYSFQGTILDSANSDMNFINCQNNYDDQDRSYIQTASGSYSSAAQRFAMGQATSSTYQIPLKCFANQIQNEILNANHNFRVSLTLDQLVNVIDVNGLSGTPNINFNSISLLVKMQKLTQPTINYKIAQMGKLQRYQGLFTSNLSQQFVALSGSTTSSINLSNFINANIQWIYFTIRPVSGLTKAASFNYNNNLLSFHLLNSSSESLCGGSAITSNTALYILNKDTTRGSFSCETGGSVFYWFHSSNPIASYQSGIPSGSRTYNGAEQLVLVYNSALATNYQIDVYAAATSVFNQTLSGVSRS